MAITGFALSESPGRGIAHRPAKRMFRLILQDKEKKQVLRMLLLLLADSGRAHRRD